MKTGECTFLLTYTFVFSYRESKVSAIPDESTFRIRRVDADGDAWIIMTLSY
jgi:hypothetical protein